MYKKKSKMPMIATILVALVMIAAFLLYHAITGKKPDIPVVTPVEEVAEHQITIHKTNAGTLEFDNNWFAGEEEDMTILKVPDNTLVSMKITPKTGKYLDEVILYEAASVTSAVNKVLTKTDGGKYNLDFTMPDKDIVMTLQFGDVETEKPVTEVETEAEEETEGNPYGLTLHGVTADVITAYNGQFDDRDFLQQLGDSLHVSSARSEYAGIKDVTISTEKYTGSQDSDKVYEYIYFENDPTWKVLSTYNLKEGIYTFTKPAVPEPESENHTGANNNNGNGGTYQSGSSSSTAGTSGSQGGTQLVSEVSLDIMQVSSTFMEYTGGDKSKFYDEVFTYVADTKKMRGKLVGTFASYKINLDEKTASFEISLNTGGTVKGTYKKSDNSYSISGL